MKNALISGAAQPVQKLRIKGSIVDGLCRSSYQAYFENKRDSPIEVSFTFALPAGVCPTHFMVKYGDKKVTSKISSCDDARMDYDDAIASSDFAAMAIMNQNGDLSIDMGPLSPSEKCKISIFYEIALSPIPNGYLLVLPTSISSIEENLRSGLNPPQLQLKMLVKDSKGIKSLSTPFTENTKVVIEQGVVTCDKLSVFHPFHLVVQHPEQLIGQCLYQVENNKSYARIVATTPRTMRDHPSQFTILVEQGPQLTSGNYSLLYRALEFFVLSIPHGSLFNLAQYGFNDHKIFDKPVEMNEENRKNSLAFIRKMGGDGGKSVEFYKALVEATQNIDMNMESIVVVVGSGLNECPELPENHHYFFMDPFSRGDLRLAAALRGAAYIPVPDEQSVIASFLRIIKLTSTEPFCDVCVHLNDVIIPIQPVLPGATISVLVSADVHPVNKASLSFENAFIDLPVKEAELPVIHHLWAFEKIKVSTPEDAKRIAIEAQIMIPDVSAVAVIERDRAIEGDVSHVVAKMGKHGIQFEHKIEKPPTPDPPAPDPVPNPIPHPVPLPHPFPLPHPQPIPFPYPHPVPRPPNPIIRPGPPTYMPHPIMRPFQRRSVINGEILDDPLLIGSENTVIIAEQSPNDDATRSVREQASRTRSRKKVYIGQMGGMSQKPDIKIMDDPNFVATPVYERIDLLKELQKLQESRKRTQAPPLSRKPFFLLRTLQLQNPNGSWTDEKSIATSCGFSIPSESKGFPRDQFLTCFVLACLRAKAQDDEEKYELIVEKAFTFLNNSDPSREWESVIEEIKSDLK